MKLGASASFEFEFPGLTMTLSPFCCVSSNPFKNRDFLVAIQAFDVNGGALSSEDVDAAYSKDLGHPYRYLNISKEDPDVLSCPSIEMRRPIKRAILTVAPWKYDRASLGSISNVFGAMYVSARSLEGDLSWTTFARSINRD